MNSYQIAVVPGDGIGPEVCEAAVRTIEVACGREVGLDLRTYPAGAGCYLKTGNAFPAETMDGCRKAHAILHGAAGDPRVRSPDGTEPGLDFGLKLRFALDLYANIRPIRLYPGIRSRIAGKSVIDYVIVRENTEGLYSARGGGTVLRNEVATDTMVITRSGTERVARMAAELSRERSGAPLDGKKRVTVCDKANVLRTFAFFRKCATDALQAFSEIEIDYVLSDAMTVHLIERPERFDVIVTENLIGDLISDLGAATVGGMGMSPSAEVGDEHGFFQASHGSAPDIAGEGIANPIGTIASAAFMLEWLGKRHRDPAAVAAGGRIRGAIEQVLASGRALTRDLGGSASTKAATDAIIAAIQSTGAQAA